MQKLVTPLHMTTTKIENYLQAKLDSGVSPVAVEKYKNPLNSLQKWIGHDTELTAARLQEWRKYLETNGYRKSSVQSNVKVVNAFLRFYGRQDLCIPKPLRNDLTNRRFGYLKALEPTDKRQHRYVVWRCECKCGKEVEVPSGMLLEGHTTSCGCLNTEILQHHNRYEEGTELRQSLEEKVINPNSASGYVGVYPKRDKWKACIQYKKKLYNLGTYSNIEDAIKARARAKEAIMEDAARIYTETDHLYGESPRRPAPPERVPFIPPDPAILPLRRNDNTSGYPGVTKQYGKWNVSITVNKHRYRLGAYDALEDAIAIRKKAEHLVLTGDLETLKAICTNRK